MKTVVGLFDDYTSAEAASAALQSAGFARSDISMMATSHARDYALRPETVQASARRKSNAAAGAGVGAAVGGATGLLVGVGALAIPGLGPLVAAGPIAGLLAGAGAGAAAGGLIGALTRSGIPKEHAEYYAEGVRRGGTLVMLRADDARAQEAADIFERYGAIDLEQRAAMWRNAGFTRYDERAPAFGADELGSATLPVVEEQLEIGKREVTTGGVRVRSYVTEQPVEEQVALQQERVVVTRQPVDRPATAADMRKVGQQDIEITERGERPVVQKTSKVVEEVTVGKQVDKRVETVRDTVKRTDVDVQRTGGEATSGAGAWGAHLADFRSDFDRRYASAGARWEDYEPAYRYGFGLSDEARYGAREWDAIERDVRDDWERNRPGTWERVKDAIRFSWQKARARRGARMDERRI